MKNCSTCKLLKAFFNFCKDSYQKDGHKNTCKACNLEYEKQYRINNSDKVRAAQRRRYWANKEHYDALNSARQKRLKKENPNYGKNRKKPSKEWINAYARAYRKNHKAYDRAKAAWQASARLQRTPKWLTKEQRKEIKAYYELALELQWLSDPSDPLQVDHIVPLKGKLVSGLHVPWNLQILPRSQNIAKSNKF